MGLVSYHSPRWTTTEDEARAPTSVDWGLEDSKGKPIEKVREIRDEIERKVITLIDQNI